MNLKTVYCSLEHIVLVNAGGINVDSVQVRCPGCNQVASSYGTSEASIRRSCRLLKDECGCPYARNQYYTVRSPLGGGVMKIATPQVRPIDPGFFE